MGDGRGEAPRGILTGTPRGRQCASLPLPTDSDLLLAARTPVADEGGCPLLCRETNNPFGRASGRNQSPLAPTSGARGADTPARSPQLADSHPGTIKAPKSAR